MPNVSHNVGCQMYLYLLDTRTTLYLLGALTLNRLLAFSGDLFKVKWWLRWMTTTLTTAQQKCQIQLTFDFRVSN